LHYKAEKEFKSGVNPVKMKFDLHIESGIYILDYNDIIKKCLEKRPGSALGFHIAVCDMIKKMCITMRKDENINDIALSGGVFQNSFLLEMVINNLSKLKFNVYTNEFVSPNDGGIALGQAYIGIRRLKNKNVHSGADGNY
jgi:hydrogenase maturation protein HypF